MKITEVTGATMFGRSDYPQAHKPGVSGVAVFSDGYHCRFNYRPNEGLDDVVQLFQREAKGWRGADPGWTLNTRPSPARLAAVSDWMNSEAGRALWADLEAAEVAKEQEAARREQLRREHHLKREAGPALFDALHAALKYLPAGCPAIATADAALALADGRTQRQAFACRVRGERRWDAFTYALNADSARTEYAFGVRGWSGGQPLPEEVETITRAEYEALDRDER